VEANSTGGQSSRRAVAPSDDDDFYAIVSYKYRIIETDRYIEDFTSLCLFKNYTVPDHVIWESKKHVMFEPTDEANPMLSGRERSSETHCSFTNLKRLRITNRRQIFRLATRQQKISAFILPVRNG
jgi:hypothetical protein